MGLNGQQSISAAMLQNNSELKILKTWIPPYIQYANKISWNMYMFKNRIDENAPQDIIVFDRYLSLHLTMAIKNMYGLNRSEVWRKTINKQTNKNE